VEANIIVDKYDKQGEMAWMTQGLPTIDGLIQLAVDDCISVGYNTKTRWPLNFVFDSSNGQSCIHFSRAVERVKQASSNPGIELNKLYSPSTNDGDTTYGTLKNNKETACIFNTVKQQISFYSPDSNAALTASECRFDTGQCEVECKRYPLIYQTGGMVCQYPVAGITYSDITSLLNYVWDRLKDRFAQNLKDIPVQAQTPPSQLPFFTESQRNFPGWTYNALPVQNYMSNINPDTTKEVMCAVTQAKDAINFTVCNDKNYDALRQFTNSLRGPGASVVPSDTQLRWKVGRSFLARGALFAFANHTRKDEEVLLANIFNTNTRCGAGEQMFNRVCLTKTTGASATYQPWVPWLSGQWNPYEFCDVQLQELSQGNQEMIWPYDLTTCPECPTNGGEYRSKFMFDRLSPTCHDRRQTYAKQVNVDPLAPTNLCYIKMENEENVCRHAQGMVGGERGQTVLNHPSTPNLYDTSNLTVPEGSAGLFPRAPNSLLNGLDAPSGQYGFLAIPGDELGVTTLGLAVDTVEGGVPYLRVARLPLQKDRGYLGSMDSSDVSQGWVKALGAMFAAEDALHLKEQSSRGNAGWDCPVRRAGFYSNAVGGQFVPVLPSPGRARRMFAQLTQGLSAHPTVNASRDGSRVGGYLTSNGFCFCPSGLASEQAQCLIPLSDTVHNCSLRRTIDGLRGGWVQSYVFPPTQAGGGDSTCRMQFDWPYVGGG